MHHEGRSRGKKERKKEEEEERHHRHRHRPPASSSEDSDEVPPPALSMAIPALDPSLFSHLPSGELLHRLLNLHLLSSSPLVNLTTRLLHSRLIHLPLVRLPLFSSLRLLAFSHFCAGEDLSQASDTVSRLWHRLRLQAILNFALEDASDDASCDANLSIFLETIRQARHLPPDSVSFGCVKITAICPVPLLERVSSLLRWKHKHPGLHLPWQEDTLPLFASESHLCDAQHQPMPLTPEEEISLSMAKQRLWQLCEESQRVAVPLLVDAEYASVQPAIDYLTYVATLAFNRHGNGGPLVYGTIQAYLKDSFSRLKLAMDAAVQRNVPLGFKLVRGAYIVRETSTAASLGIPSPIHACIQDTHKCYDKSAAFLIQSAASNKGFSILATHNVDSARAAAAKAMEVGLVNRDPRLQFGQIKGMADSLSLALVQSGFRVSKYLAFGPIAHVVPYLIRRAEENRGVVANTSLDRRLLRQALMHRMIRLR